MLSRRIAGRYAVALFSIAQQQGHTEIWAAELRQLGEILATQPELREILVHPEVALRKKEQLITRVFQGQLSREILAVILLLIRRGHEPDMATLAELFTEEWNMARNNLPVSVVTAVPITAEQRAALIAALTKRTGANITLKTSVDPAVIAGMVITFGDRVIDAGAQHALAALQASMAGA